MQFEFTTVGGAGVVAGFEGVEVEVVLDPVVDELVGVLELTDVLEFTDALELTEDGVRVLCPPHPASTAAANPARAATIAATANL